MRIKDMKAHVLQFEATPYHWRDGLGHFPARRQALLLRVIGEDGKEGYALSRQARVMAAIVDEVFRPNVLGEDTRYREYIWQKIWDLDRIHKFPMYAQGALDVAIWDLAAKEAGLPVYQLLGGYRDKVPAYASTLTLDSIEEYVELTKDCLARGYKAIKLHLWGRPQQDVAACRAVRETAGPDIRLMVDASGGYDHEQALWVGRELEKLDYYWYEEPVRDYDFYGLAELRRTLTIPILMAETSWGGVFETANNLLGRTGDIVHADVWLNHGVTGCIKTAHLCEAFGVKCQIHGGGRPNLHLICAIKNCEYFESPVPEGRSETGAFQNPPIMPDKDGFVHVPQEPGFGTEPDWEWVEKHTIEQV